MPEQLQVLLVEDNPIALLSARVILEQKKLTVHGVSSGKDALNAAKSKVYDLIFMDIGLEEGTDGIIITEEIQKESMNEETPVVILSANSSAIYQDRLNNIHFIEYLNKPLTGDLIDEVLHQLNKSSKK